MINSVGSNVNALQILKATQAFKAAVEENPKAENLLNENFSIEDKVSISSEALNIKPSKTEQTMSEGQQKHVEEFKEYLKGQNEFNVDKEDIIYALTYGESILVDQTA